MKVLFAVSNDNITTSVIQRYQQKFKEIITSKNVYYFNAIIKELQRDRTYDSIVIGEDLEPLSDNNYDEVDKFIYEKMDIISDEASKPTGEEIPIILICSDRRTKTDSLLRKLFGLGVYNLIIGMDRSVDNVCNLIYKPRNKKEAKLYYKIDSSDVEYKTENEDVVNENEIQNIQNHFNKIINNERKIIDSFDRIAEQYNDTQLRIISNFLPINAKIILEKKSAKYIKLMTGGTVLSNGTYSQYNKQNPRSPASLDVFTQNLDSPEVSGNVIIPSSMNVNNTNNLQQNNNVYNQNRMVQQRPQYGNMNNGYNQNGMMQQRPQYGSMNNGYNSNGMMQQRSQYGNMNNGYNSNGMMQQRPQYGNMNNGYSSNGMMQQRPQYENMNNSFNQNGMNQQQFQNNIVTENNISKDESSNNIKDNVLDKSNSINEPKTYNDEFSKEETLRREEKIKKEIEPIDSTLPYNPNTSEGTRNSNYSIIENKTSNTNVSDENDESETDEKEVKIVRGRGRPKKDKIDISDTPKRKRGRPRKDNLEESEGINQNANIDNDVELTSILPNDNEQKDSKNVIQEYGNIQQYQNNIINNSQVFRNGIIGNTNTQPNTNSQNDNNNKMNISGQQKNSNESYSSWGNNNNINKNYNNANTQNNFDNVNTSYNNANTQNNFDNVNTSYNNANTQNNFDNINTNYNNANTQNNFDNINTNYNNANTQNNFDNINTNYNNMYTSNFLNNGNPNSNFSNDIKAITNESSNSNVRQVIGTNENKIFEKEINESMKNNSLDIKNKIVAFTGTSKNGISFLVNNLGLLISKSNIKVAILDLTKDKNDFYMFTDSEEELVKVATTSLKNLNSGNAMGLNINDYLTLYTALPNGLDDKNLIVDTVVDTLRENYDLVMLDCDFYTNKEFFDKADEIYLVQSMDALTIQPLTKFLSDLKSIGYLKEDKLRIVLNKYVKLKKINEKTIINGLSKYNEPSFSMQKELFNKDNIPYVIIPFENEIYTKYLEQIALCQLSFNGYSDKFLKSLENLAEVVYPLNGKISLKKKIMKSKKKYKKVIEKNFSEQQNLEQMHFSNDITDTLNKMRSNL